MIDAVCGGLNALGSERMLFARAERSWVGGGENALGSAVMTNISRFSCFQKFLRKVPRFSGEVTSHCSHTAPSSRAARYFTRTFFPPLLTRLVAEQDRLQRGSEDNLDSEEPLTERKLLSAAVTAAAGTPSHGHREADKRGHAGPELNGITLVVCL